MEQGEYLMSHHDSKGAIKKFRLAGLLGHAGALTTTAVHLLAGDTKTHRNIPSAVRHLRLASNAGQPDAHALLGTLHASGIADRHGISKSHAKSTLYWTFAAEASNTYASTALGFRYLYGIGVQRSCQISAHHYRHAARAIATHARYWPSPTNFVQGKPPLPSGLVETPPTRLDDTYIKGNNADATDQEVVHFYRHSADRGNAADRTTLGALHFFGGHGINPDEIEARRHLDIAAGLNNGQAHTMLGHLEMRAHRNESAFQHFMHGAALHDHLSHYALGMIHCYGLIGHEINYSKAKMHFELVIDGKGNHSGALFQLGMLYWNGKGVERDSGRAFELFKESAKGGNLQSKWNVGAMLTNDAEQSSKSEKEKENECMEGVELLKEVAEDGEWKTVLEMAMEKVEEKDWFGALHRYLEAGHAGIELGQYNAAFLLERLSSDDIKELQHWNRRRMLTEASELYEYSALQGHTNSLIRSAKVFYVEMKDYSYAASIFEKAANLGNAEGMVSLALMYAKGLGVPQSRLEATRHFETASKVDDDAIAPSTVGLFLVQVYWLLEDLENDVLNAVSSLKLWFSANGQSENIKESKSDVDDNDEIVEVLKLKLMGDVVVVGALLAALVAVLIVRTKRMARETGPGSRSASRRGR